MQLTFLTLAPAERQLYFEQAARRRGVLPAVLEKDFWVCWLLGVLFESPYAEALVFKGGTSLSKVFGVIARFSEDIDLSLAPAFLPLAPPTRTSRNQAHKWMQAAEAACGQAVREQIAPTLERTLVTALGPRPGGWLQFLTDPTTHSPTLLFHYPCTHGSGFPYLPRSVKLEFGSLTDQQPTGRHTIRPWIADTLSDVQIQSQINRRLDDDNHQRTPYKRGRSVQHPAYPIKREWAFKWLKNPSPPPPPGCAWR